MTGGPARYSASRWVEFACFAVVLFGAPLLPLLHSWLLSRTVRLCAVMLGFFALRSLSSFGPRRKGATGGAAAAESEEASKLLFLWLPLAILFCSAASLRWSVALPQTLGGYERMCALVGVMSWVALGRHRHFEAAPAAVMILIVFVLASGTFELLFPLRMPAEWVDPALRPSIGNRVSSVFCNPNLFGAWLIVTLGALSARLINAGPGEWERWTSPTWLLVLASLVNLNATFSRGAWAGLLFLAGWLLLSGLAGRRGGAVVGDGAAASGRRWRCGALLLLLFAATALPFSAGMTARIEEIVGNRGFGVAQRKGLYLSCLAYARAFLPLGSGLNTFFGVYPLFRGNGGQYPYEAHDDALHLCCELGLAGVMLLAVTWTVLGGREGIPPESIAAWIGAGLTVTTWYYSFLACWVPLSWIICDAPSRAPGGSSSDGSAPSRGAPGKGFVSFSARVSPALFLAALFPGLLVWGRQLEEVGLWRLARERGMSTDEIVELAGGSVVAVELLWEGGKSLEKAGAWEQAIALYDRGCVLVPLEPLFHVGRASCLWRMGRREAALRAAMEALRRDPCSVEVTLFTAGMLAASGRRREAAGLLSALLRRDREFIRLQPYKYRTIFLLLDRCYHRLGRIRRGGGAVVEGGGEGR